MRRGTAAALAGAAALAIASAAPATAGKPQRERIAIDSTFHDEFLTAACGTDVTTTAQGHVIVREYPADRRNVEIVTISITLIARSDEGTFRFRDVGVDTVRRNQDGTLTRSVIGQVPFAFTGILREVDGTVVKEPVHSLEGRIATACRALNPS